MKTKIYIYCSPTRRDPNGSGIKDHHGNFQRPNSEVYAVALSEDGIHCGSHLCSSEAYVPHDMGVTSDWKHDGYKETFPNGYELIYLGKLDDPRGNDELLTAYMKYVSTLSEDYIPKLPEWVQESLKEAQANA